MGISGHPAGQAQQSFPIVTLAERMLRRTRLVDPHRHPRGELYAAGQPTVGEGQPHPDGRRTDRLAAVQHDLDTGNTSPLTLATAVTETAGMNNASATVTNTGAAYASFLVGQIDKGSFTQYVQQEFGARFRAISPYVQDNWKVNSKLTLDLGLRYDFFPSVTEVHNNRASSTRTCPTRYSAGRGR